MQNLKNKKSAASDKPALAPKGMAIVVAPRAAPPPYCQIPEPPATAPETPTNCAKCGKRYIRAGGLAVARRISRFVPHLRPPYLVIALPPPSQHVVACMCITLCITTRMGMGIGQPQAGTVGHAAGEHGHGGRHGACGHVQAPRRAMVMLRACTMPAARACARRPANAPLPKYHLA